MKTSLYLLKEDDSIESVMLHGIMSKLALVVSRDGSTSQVLLEQPYVDIDCTLRFSERMDLTLKTVEEED